MLISALVNQVMSDFFDPSRDVARMNNNILYLNQRNGLLLGERHSGYSENQRICRERMNQTFNEDVASN